MSGFITRPPLTFDDFSVGDSYVTPRRTITEADVVAFAGLSGDFNPLHTDQVFAQNTGFGRPIAHGLLVLAVASGLNARMGLADGTTLAFLGIEEWNFRKPVFFGDTVYAKATIVSKRETSHLEKGIVTRHMEVFNQHDTLVQEGQMIIMLRRDPERIGAETQP